MRAQTLLQTLVLANAVFAAPVARPGLPLLSGLPLDDLSAVTDKLPLGSVEGLTTKLPVDTDAVTGAVPVKTDAITGALPVKTDAITGALPLGLVRRQIIDLSKSVSKLGKIIPVDIDAVTGALPKTVTTTIPVNVAPRQLADLLDPVTSTLTTLVGKFSTLSSTLSSAATKLNGMVPGNVDNGDAMLDSLMATMATVKPQVDDAVDKLQSSNVQGLLNQVTAEGSSDTAKKVNASLGSMSLALNQILKDSDSISGLGVQGYAAKISALQGPAYAMLAKIKKASGTSLPL